MVKIESFEKIIYIEEFTIEREINNHSLCKFKALIKDEDLNQFFSNLNKKVGITFEKDGKKEKIFYGVVKSVEGIRFRHSSQIEVEIISTSYLESLDEKNRVFQNPEKNLENIFNCLKMKDLKVEIADNSLGKEKIELPIFQNKISNFRFIEEIFNQIGEPIVVDDISDTNISLKIGFSQQEKHDLGNEKYSLKSLKKELGSEEIKVILDKNCFIGDILTLDGEEYEIKKSTLFYENNVYNYRYYAEKKKEKSSKGLNLDCMLNKFQPEGEVIENKDPESKGRIKIKFDESIEECETGDGYWFEFLSLYSGKNCGMVFLPEIGAKISVKQIGEKLFCENSGREENKEEHFKNPNIKTIKNMFNKSITFEEKMLEIKNGEGDSEDPKTNFIRLLDDKLEIKIGDKKLIIDDERILLENKEVKLELTDKIKMLVKSSGIQIESEKILMESKNLNMDSSGNVEIKSGSKTEMKSGNMKIESGGIEIKGSNIGMKANNINLN